MNNWDQTHYGWVILLVSIRCSSVMDGNFESDFQQHTCDPHSQRVWGWTTSMPADGRCARKGAQPRPPRARASSFPAAGGARAAVRGRLYRGMPQLGVPLGLLCLLRPRCLGAWPAPRGSHQGGSVGSRGIHATRGGRAHMSGDLTVKIGWRPDGMALRAKKFRSILNPKP
jgi:hypothetical protein